MSKIVMWLKKTLLIGVVASLGLSALPLASVYALSPNDTPTPTQISNDKLQQIWAKEQLVYAKIGTLLDRADLMIPKIQALIDKAKQNGKDVSAVQAALDAFSNAVKQAHPIYESAKGIIASHQGFDDTGAVTDPTKALETVKDLRNKFLEIRQVIGDTGKNLRQAIKDFRAANQPTPTPVP